MYIIIRKNKETNKEQVCFIAAETSEKAKRMVGVPESHTAWVFASEWLVRGLVEVKEGYAAMDL